jgi:hypothetical protein
MSMRPNGVCGHGDFVREPSDDASKMTRLIHRATALVRKRPVVAAAAAGALGAALGGLVFSGLGRLVFVGAAGYFVSDLWRREGRIDIETLVASLSSDVADVGAA